VGARFVIDPRDLGGRRRASDALDGDAAAQGASDEREADDDGRARSPH
jgi:hypothetical protein